MGKRAAAREQDTTERLNGLLARTQTGDPAAMVEARAILDAEPALWDQVGDLAAIALRSWVDLVAGAKNEVAQEAMRRRLRALKDDLGANGASAVERLLINRVLMCWIQVHHAEGIYAMHEGKMLSFAEHDFHQRRLTQAQRRYLAAIRSLVTVRRLLVPRLPDVRIDRVGQLNVARHQLNGAAVERVLR